MKEGAGTNTTKKILYIILAALDAVCIAAFIIIFIIFAGLGKKLPSQNAAESWKSENGGKYDQISVFFSGGSGLDLNEIRRMRVDIDKKMTENSLTPEKEGARLYFDAFSCAEQKMTVSTMSDSYAPNVDANTIVTGGDFFRFHPFKLLSGCYYSDDDLMQDRVVIDDTLAWQLFGSSNVEGMAVSIGGKIFTVSGVVKLEQDKTSQYLVSGKPYMFISYEGIKLIREEAPEISCYEAVLPSPVKGLARSVIKNILNVPEENRTLIVNTGRFSVINMTKAAFDGGKSAVIDKPIVYPYWENAARITERKASSLISAMIVLLCTPIITVLYFAVLLFTKRKAITHKLSEKLRETASSAAQFFRNRTSRQKT
ncbi:MAG: ABC transporter permease [Oscillospiraceae bacterium]